MKSIRLTHILPLIILLSGFYFLGNTPRPQEDHRHWPSREQILDNLFSGRRLLFVYGTGRPELVAHYRAWAAAYQKRTRRLQITIKSDREVTRTELASQAVYLAGTVASNSWLAHFSPQLPAKFHRDGFQFLGKDYREPGDLIVLFYPNPANPQQPLLLLAGNRDEEVLRSELFRPGGDYRIFRNGECLVFGHFSQAADQRWTFDAAGHHDFAAETRLAKETEHFRFYTHGAVLPAAELELFAAEREQHHQRLTAFLGKSEAGPRIDYHLYPSFEQKGLITASTEIAHCDRERQAVHVTVSQWVRGETEGCEADLVIARALGVPRHALLATGLRVSFTDNWRNHGYEYWASRLYLSGNVPKLAEMLDNANFARESCLIMAPRPSPISWSSFGAARDFLQTMLTGHRPRMTFHALIGNGRLTSSVWRTDIGRRSRRMSPTFPAPIRFRRASVTRTKGIKSSTAISPAVPMTRWPSWRTWV